MNFISISFWAAFCAFFLVYIFLKRWSRTAMLLWVLAFDLFFFWQANGYLMLLLPATAAVNYFFTELLRQLAGAETSSGAGVACRRRLSRSRIRGAESGSRDSGKRGWKPRRRSCPPEMFAAGDIII